MQSSKGSKAQSKKPLTGANPLQSTGANAPSVTLPLRFIIAALASLLGGVLLLSLRPDVLTSYHYNQYIIAITHLFVLGWVCTIVMGAVYQLVPVALETRLHSERLASAQFLFHVIGVAGMVWMFWKWDMKQVGHFGSVFAFGVLLFAYNIFRTLLRVPKWNVVAVSVASSVFWLGCTVLFGLAIAAGKCTYETAENPQAQGTLVAILRGMAALAGKMAQFDAIGAMHAHAHLGAVGVFIVLIVGVSYRLVPMFTLSELQSPARALSSIIILNCGLLGTFLAVLTRSALKHYAAGVVVLGLVLYAIEMRAILRHRKRRVLDMGLVHFLTGTALLGLTAIVGLVLSLPSLPLTAFTGQLETVYALVGILGVVSLAIIGMLYKIIPFIVWYSCYSKQIGLRKVPSLAELYSERIQKVGYVLFLCGLGTLCAGALAAHPLAARMGAIIFGFGALSLLSNVVVMLSHYRKSKSAPHNTARASVKTPLPALATSTSNR